MSIPYAVAVFRKALVSIVSRCGNGLSVVRTSEWEVEVKLVGVVRAFHPCTR